MGTGFSPKHVFRVIKQLKEDLMQTEVNFYFEPIVNGSKNSDWVFLEVNQTLTVHLMIQGARYLHQLERIWTGNPLELEEELSKVKDSHKNPFSFKPIHKK